MEGSWKVRGKIVESVWKVRGRCVESSWKVRGKIVESWWKVPCGRLECVQSYGVGAHPPEEFDVALEDCRVLAREVVLGSCDEGGSREEGGSCDEGG